MNQTIQAGKAIPAAIPNKRQFLRIKPAPGAPVRVDINGEDFIDATRAVDISESGMGIHVPHGFRGCHVDLPASFVIHLPQPVNKFFRVEGLIRHVRDNSFGVRFTNVSDKTRTMLRQYIAHNLKQRGWWDYFLYSIGLLR